MIKVEDIAFVRFRAPDLDEMERFLVDFGMVRSARTDSALYMRGTDPSHHVHVTEQGDPEFLGVAFRAASAEDLAAAAAMEGASGVERIDEPGGGSRVVFRDPDGIGVEVVYGVEALAPLPVRGRPAVNTGSSRRRRGELVRIEPGPGQVKRLGHCVVLVTDFAKSQDWYKSRFGFLSSDEVYLGDPSNRVAAFMRCDRGDDYVDHHTFLCVASPNPGFEHAAFEVEDLDHLMLGHDHLTAQGYTHFFGVGRHILGSQIFDYWKDPWGRTLEHWTDGDLLNARAEETIHEPSAALSSQWGATPRGDA